MSFRVEEKLFVRSSQLGDLQRWLAVEKAELLHPKRRIYSTYFDSDDMAIYAASEEGSVPRKKIRIRTYGADNHFEHDNALEIKVSSVEGRFKTTDKLSFEQVRDLLSAGVYDPSYGSCLPVVSVSYDREYFQAKDVRLTIDTDIEYCAYGSCFPVRDDGTAVEIKAGSAVSMDLLACDFPFRRIRFSKYARAINAIQKGTSEWF